MKQILVQLDDRLAAQLEQIAPGRSHKRSAFVRRALARAVQEELERRTRAAYEKWPDEPVPVDLRAWAPEDEAMHPAPAEERPGKAKTKTKPKTKTKARTKTARRGRHSGGRA
jgi:hypothetical protein